MRVRNVSGLLAAAVPGRRADGRELLVVVVKATYTIGQDGVLVPAPDQEPLRYGDEFAGEPGLIASDVDPLILTPMAYAAAVASPPESPPHFRR